MAALEVVEVVSCLLNFVFLCLVCEGVSTGEWSCDVGGDEVDPRGTGAED